MGREGAGVCCGQRRRGADGVGGGQLGAVRPLRTRSSHLLGPARKAASLLQCGGRPPAVLGLEHVSLSGCRGIWETHDVQKCEEYSWPMRTMTDAPQRTQRRSGRCCRLLCVTPPGAPCACLEAQCDVTWAGCRRAITYPGTQRTSCVPHYNPGRPACEVAVQCKHQAVAMSSWRLVQGSMGTFWRRRVQRLQRVQVGGLGDALPR